MDDTPGQSSSVKYEIPLARLDATDRDRTFVGMSLFGGSARVSRPKDWSLRRAALGGRTGYVEYVSPRGFLFSGCERADAAGSFEDIERRYEEDVVAVKSKALSKSVPIATANAQGRAYLVERRSQVHAPLT